jgi:hypothetical protein
VVQGWADPQREILDVESVAGHLLPAGGVFAFLAGHRRELFPDELFADLFPSRRGRPSIPADVVASVIVLQTLFAIQFRLLNSLETRARSSESMRSGSRSLSWSSAVISRTAARTGPTACASIS